MKTSKNYKKLFSLLNKKRKVITFVQIEDYPKELETYNKKIGWAWKDDDTYMLNDASTPNRLHFTQHNINYGYAPYEVFLEFCKKYFLEYVK